MSLRFEPARWERRERENGSGGGAWNKLQDALHAFFANNLIEQITDLHTQNAMRCPTQLRLATITQQPDRQTVLQTVKQ